MPCEDNEALKSRNSRMINTNYMPGQANVNKNGHINLEMIG